MLYNFRCVRKYDHTADGRDTDEKHQSVTVDVFVRLQEFVFLVYNVMHIVKEVQTFVTLTLSKSAVVSLLSYVIFSCTFKCGILLSKYWSLESLDSQCPNKGQGFQKRGNREPLSPISVG